MHLATASDRYPRCRTKEGRAVSSRALTSLGAARSLQCWTTSPLIHHALDQGARNNGLDDFSF
jgi:hypothetical protein